MAARSSSSLRRGHILLLRSLDLDLGLASLVSSRGVETSRGLSSSSGASSTMSGASSSSSSSSSSSRWTSSSAAGSSRTAPGHSSSLLRSLVLLEHDIAQSCAFFREGLGANVALATEGWAEIEVGVDSDDGVGTCEGARGRAREDGDRACVVRLHLKRRAAADAGDGTRIEETVGEQDEGAEVEGSGVVRTGHPSSMLVFRVRDVQACLVKMMAHGGAMDGRIEYGLDGTTQAGVYTPGGTLLGLVSR